MRIGPDWGVLKVLLTDGMWRRHFSADPTVLGRAITLDGKTYTVAGILPPEFEFPSRK